ncbi:hypothetical protein [Winkia sp. UMB3105]|nr:hypothetical protein [Winkia sp. UMB3105]
MPTPSIAITAKAMSQPENDSPHTGIPVARALAAGSRVSRAKP